MDLSKAFDTLNHELLIAKLNAYGFSHSSLKLLLSYLTDRWQRTKINYTYSSWTEIMQGVPQGSILGPLLFNIYLNDLFYLDIDSNLCNYADDNTLYQCDANLSELIRKLETSARSVIHWFSYNYMKLNESKCKLLVTGNKEEVIIASVGDVNVIESHKVKLLGICIDRELKFNENVNIKCNIAGKKLNALMRLGDILPFHRKRQLINCFVESQFSYAPLLSLFHSREVNNKVNNLHYRALRFLYRDDVSSFKELLKKDNSVTIHQRNIQFLAIELYKVKSGIGPYLIQEIFTPRNIPENSMVASLRTQTDFYNYHNPKSVRFGNETLRTLGPKIWNIIPPNIKNSASLNAFKENIKKWTPTDCPCRICKCYIQGIGFIE